jgi:MIP family channel proteins
MSSEDVDLDTVDPHALVNQDDTWRSLLKPASAEAVGCCFFIFIAVGTAISTADFGSPGTTQIGIALVFGFTIFVIAFTIGHISGGHLNPAVTISFLVVRKISWKRALMYFIGQMGGGLFGAYLLLMWTPPRFHSNCMGANMLGNGVTVGMAFGYEFILTFFLLTVVNAASDITKSNTTLVPLAIGYAVLVAHFAGLSIDGCSINPMRSFASAFASLGFGDDCRARVWSPHWVFWVGPILGGIAGTALYEFFFSVGGGIANNLIAMYSLATRVILEPSSIIGRLRKSQGPPVR